MHLLYYYSLHNNAKSKDSKSLLEKQAVAALCGSTCIYWPYYPVVQSLYVNTVYSNNYMIVILRKH